MTKPRGYHASDIRLFLIKLIVYILIVFPHIISVGIIFPIFFIQRSQNRRPKVTVHKNVRVLLEGGPYLKKHGIQTFLGSVFQEKIFSLFLLALCMILDLALLTL